MEYREIVIRIIRERWFYEQGTLEKMTDEELQETYERFLDWVEG